MKLEACVTLKRAGNELLLLKKNLLVMDRLFYLPPTYHRVTDEALKDRKKAYALPSGKLLIGRDFDFFTDTIRDMSLVPDSFDDGAVRDLIHEFQEASVLTPARRSKGTPDGFQKDLMDQLVRAQCHDNFLLGIPEDTKQVNIELKSNAIRARTVGRNARDQVFYVISAPDVIEQAFQTTENILYADTLNAFPLFLGPNQHRAVSLRISRFQRALPLLKDASPELFDKFSRNSALGNLSFQLMSELVPDEAVSHKSPKEILKLRSDLAESRERFFDSELAAFLEMMETIEGRNEKPTAVRDYIDRKLTPRLREYEDSAREIVERSWGAMAVAAVKAGRDTGIGGLAGAGGSAGGLLAQLLPAASLWEVAAVGCFVGALKAAPDIAKVVSDAILERKKVKRNPLAFIKRLNDLGK